MPEPRGGGDFDLESNWHGPERDMAIHNITPGPMPKDYSAIARHTIGRWAGDRIALVGDYAEDSDLPAEFEASKIWDKTDSDEYTDITDYVAAVMEHELCGKFEGTGWRRFRYDNEDDA